MYRFCLVLFLVLAASSDGFARDRHDRHRQVVVRRPAARACVSRHVRAPARYSTPRYSRPSYRPSYRHHYRSYVPSYPVVVAAPVVVPAPVVYVPQPVYVESTPVVYQQPVVVVPPPVVEIQLPAGFVECERRYHKKGSDAGQLDWVKGRWNGQRVKLYFNPDGSVRKQKYDD